jgi:hypothetical protein
MNAKATPVQVLAHGYVRRERGIALRGRVSHVGILEQGYRFIGLQGSGMFWPYPSMRREI